MLMIKKPSKDLKKNMCIDANVAISPRAMHHPSTDNIIMIIK